MKIKFIAGREFILFTLLLMFAVAVNWPVVVSNFMYPEQPLFYNANQLIHSFADFIHVYTHPQLLDVATPFSRPSGNFLMYQLITPFIGWHNTMALMIVNFLFLGMTGYLIIKLYAMYFPGFKWGGYIAFSLYLMNPDLLIPKLTIMHFEFAYVFFVLLSLYCFSVFCKENFKRGEVISLIKFQHLHLLLATLLFYVVAVTFKEPAIMLGPVLAFYFLCAAYQPQQLTRLCRNKEILTIFFLLVMVSVTLAVYLSMSWRKAYHPLFVYSNLDKTIAAAHAFRDYLLNLPHQYVPAVNDSLMVEILRLNKMPQFMRYVSWVILAITAVTCLNVFRQKNSDYKKSLIFLFTALLLFMLLPLLWGMGFAWHLSLSLVCEALILGFGVEFYLRNFLTKEVSYFIGLTLAILIGLATYQVDQLNLAAIPQMQAGFPIKLNYNAIHHPPAIKDQLNEQSILVVQDNMNIGDYFLGDSVYSLLSITQSEDFNFDTFIPGGQQNMFWQVKPKYNGTLFRWAYLMPNLKEEVVPFQNNDMRLVTNATLADWLRHIKNIFCVTFDKEGNWFDNTAIFKKSIVAEQKRRHLFINNYHALSVSALHANAVKYQRLPYADAELCQTACDKTRACKGFTYIHFTKGGNTVAQCFYYNKITADIKHCQVCTGYIKNAV
ncbi:MAG: hypothetical protein V4501_04080 [Pseudomonadota bacterium]